MKKPIILVLMAILLLVGCENKEQDANNHNKIKVTASTYPMYYIAKEIGQDNIDLDTLVPTGVDPHEYEISLKEVKDLEKTDLFIYNGSGLEHWGEKVSDNFKDKNKNVIKASEFVKLLNIEDNHSKAHDDNEDHKHGDKDPHIWLDPMNIDKIAVVVKEKLKELDPENAEEYEKNFIELSEKLMKLDGEYREELKDKKEDTILVSHRAFAYLADRYDLKQIAITGISPHAEPSPKSLAELIT